MKSDCAKSSSQRWGAITAAFFDNSGNLSSTDGCDYHQVTVMLPAELDKRGTAIDLIVALEKGRSLKETVASSPSLMSDDDEHFNWLKHPNKLLLAEFSQHNLEADPEILDEFVKLVCRSVVHLHSGNVDKNVEAQLAAEIAGSFGRELNDIHIEDTITLDGWPFKISAFIEASELDVWVNEEASAHGETGRPEETGRPWLGSLAGVLAGIGNAIRRNPAIAGLAVAAAGAAIYASAATLDPADFPSYPCPPCIRIPPNGSPIPLTWNDYMCVEEFLRESRIRFLKWMVEVKNAQIVCCPPEGGHQEL